MVWFFIIIPDSSHFLKQFITLYCMFYLFSGQYIFFTWFLSKCDTIQYFPNVM